MPAPLGVRACPTVGCARRITPTPGGVVHGRCDDCIRRYLREAFAATGTGPDRRVPDLRSGSVPVAVPAYRPAA